LRSVLMPRPRRRGVQRKGARTREKKTSGGESEGRKGRKCAGGDLSGLRYSVQDKSVV